MPSQSRSTRWCFTINNPTEENETTLQALDVKYLVYGRETGEQGTFHLQGFVIWHHAKSLTSSREHLGGGHLEPARGTNAQAADYCKKDGNYYETGELPAPSGQGSVWKDFQEWVRELDHWPTDTEFADRFPNLFVRYYGGAQRLIGLYHQRVRPVNGDYRVGWQSELKHDLDGTADDRSIIFIVDKVGDEGKTWFTQKYRSQHPDKVQVLRAGASKDQAHAVLETRSIFFFDIPRGKMEFLSYDLLECLKDGMVFSPKYESKEKWWMENNHVVVFCNEMPDLNKLSEDRFDVREIN